MTEPPGDLPDHESLAAQSVAARREMLFDAWFDGVIADDEFAELEAGLLESSDMRRAYWERASTHGLLREAARIRFASLPGSAAAIAASGASVSWRGPLRRRLAAAVSRLLPILAWAGTVLVASTALAYAVHVAATIPPARVVHREGFEAPPPPGQEFQPQQFEVWGGDESEVVAAQDGILPHGGSRMLRFVSGHPRNVEYAGVVAEIWRFIDLDTLRPTAGGQPGQPGRIELSAYFNAAHSEGEAKPYGGLSLVATETHPLEFRRDWRKLFSDGPGRSALTATAEVRQVLDGDCRSWQRLTASITPPEGARYLVLHCFTEVWRDDGERLAWESLGQYLDDIQLKLVLSTGGD